MHASLCSLGIPDDSPRRPPYMSAFDYAVVALYGLAVL